MIKSFKHKGLERFFTKGITSGIQSGHAVKLDDRLTALHTASIVEDMNIPGWRLHPLKGQMKGHWAVDVNKSWRVVFKFEGGHAYIVNYEDYH